MERRPEGPSGQIRRGLIGPSGARRIEPSHPPPSTASWSRRGAASSSRISRSRRSRAVLEAGAAPHRAMIFQEYAPRGAADGDGERPSPAASATSLLALVHCAAIPSPTSRRPSASSDRVGLAAGGKRADALSGRPSASWRWHLLPGALGARPGSILFLSRRRAEASLTPRRAADHVASCGASAASARFRPLSTATMSSRPRAFGRPLRRAPRRPPPVRRAAGRRLDFHGGADRDLRRGGLGGVRGRRTRTRPTRRASPGRRQVLAASGCMSVSPRLSLRARCARLAPPPISSRARVALCHLRRPSRPTSSRRSVGGGGLERASGARLDRGWALHPGALPPDCHDPLDPTFRDGLIESYHDGGRPPSSHHHLVPIGSARAQRGALRLPRLAAPSFAVSRSFQEVIIAILSFRRLVSASALAWLLTLSFAPSASSPSSSRGTSGHRRGAGGGRALHRGGVVAGAELRHPAE